MYLHGTSTINASGHLEIGGCDTVHLAATYGTPLYVMDEALIRQRAREFMNAFQQTGLPFQVAYASKAFCTMAMCKLVEQEGLSLDVVSDGELYTALQAGFPAGRIHFHGNNKSPEEIEMAIDANIGCFVIDNFVELEMVEALAADKRKRVAVLLRVTPGVEAHTHEFISTGQTDSKFGFDVGNGSAFRALEMAKSMSYVELLGIHSHIGSQIFETEGFRMAVEKVFEFSQYVREQLDMTFRVLNFGGGFGIRYTAEDRPLHVERYVETISDAVKAQAVQFQYPVPEIWIEPGRSMVGEAGTTLYTIGTMKDIPGVRKYISVDGGMSDNPRYALYGAKYEAMLANRAKDHTLETLETVTVAGKACESGDKIIVDIQLPPARTGDLLAVSCTGAYNYSMASNYNRIRRPAVLFVGGGQADLVVKRESHEDIVGHDTIPDRMKLKAQVKN
jgi:diaminopimelate decarboxylase